MSLCMKGSPMRQRHVSWIVLILGVLALSVGIFMHGISRDPRKADDRRWLLYGTVIAACGLAFLCVGAVLRATAKESSRYRDLP